jgi:hypothetical protein
MSDETVRLPSPFKEVVQKLDPLNQGIVKVAYMDEKDYQLQNNIKGLRKYLGIGENASLCDAYVKLSQGQKSVLIEDKDTEGERALRVAYAQLESTVKLLSAKGEKVDYAVITNIRVDPRLYNCEYVKGGFPPLKQIKRKDSSRHRVLNMEVNGLEIPLYVYKE